MPVATSAAAVSAGAAAAASAAAHAARVERCKGTIAAYDSKAATVAEARDYASCVQLIHPDPLSASTVLILKMLFVFALACAVFGGYREAKDYPDAFGVIEMALVWMFGGPLAVVFVGGILYGIYWVFT